MKLTHGTQDAEVLWIILEDSYSHLRRLMTTRRMTDSSRAIHTALNLTEIDSSLKSDSWKLKQVHERRHNLDTKTGDTFMGNLQRLFTFKAHVHEYTSSLKCPRWNAHSLSSDNTYGTLWRWLWLSGVLACPATEWPPAVMTTEWPEGEEETMKL